MGQLDWKLPVRQPAEMALSGYFLLDNADDSQTPLQKKLAQLGKYLGVLALAACGIIFVVGLVNGIPPLEIFMTAVSWLFPPFPKDCPPLSLWCSPSAYSGWSGKMPSSAGSRLWKPWAVLRSSARTRPVP